MNDVFLEKIAKILMFALVEKAAYGYEKAEARREIASVSGSSFPRAVEVRGGWEVEEDEIAEESEDSEVVEGSVQQAAIERGRGEGGEGRARTGCRGAARDVH